MSARKLNLPLPEETHRSLSEASAELGIPPAELVRSLLDEWLRKPEAQRTAEEIRAFAREFAGTAADLDPELEGAAVAELVRDETR